MSYRVSIHNVRTGAHAEGTGPTMASAAHQAGRCAGLAARYPILGTSERIATDCYRVRFGRKAAGAIALDDTTYTVTILERPDDQS